MFRKSVGYGFLKYVSKVKILICDSQDQGKESLSSRISYVMVYVKFCNSLVNDLC